MKIGYARTSTADQNLDLQIDALVAAGVDCRNIYTDQVSGKKADRPGLVNARAYCSPGDEFVVWKLDRAGRSVKQLVELITDLGEAEIGFRSLTENLETTTAQGRLILGVFMHLAEFERELISERTRAGMAAAKLRGATLGRPPAIPAATLDAAATWIDNGQSVNRTAKMFGVARTTLIGALNERAEKRKASA